MILVFLFINIILFLEIYISVYMISYYKKQKRDFLLFYFEIGLKSYLFVMIAGLILAVVNIFVFDFGFFRDLSSYGSKDVPPFAIYIVIASFIIGLFSLLYTVTISATSRYMYEADENKDNFSSTHRKIFYLF